MDKTQIAKAFGKKAQNYDSHARVQKYIGAHLLTLLKEQGYELDKPVLDLGTGSGFFLSSLKGFCGEIPLYAADLSEGMIRYASAHHSDFLAATFVADAEQLPLADNSLSVIFTSMAIQWCDNFGALFNELTRVVQPGGLIAFSTLMSNTLSELKGAWDSVDQGRHVNNFLSASEIMDALEGKGELLVADTERVVASYDDVKSLLHSIKGIGANTVLNGSKPMTKGQFKSLVAAYDNYRDASGKLPASYDVFYGVLRV